MPLGLTMPGKWDGLSMASHQLHLYKHERPAYSTPQPVENTPANNECRMVEFRGAKVASFFIGGDEFICLPQAFDLFLKHLVGGLHTVYTKLKRLSIAPVVCNVEQVRILRGLGAIQPGVNRCKLITRKDFEILYQDCSQASRPGRPPKRYPMLPPTSEIISHHARMRSMNPTHGIIAANDFTSLHEHMQLDHEHGIRHRQLHEVNANDASDMEGRILNGKDLSSTGAKGSMDLQTNSTALYLQQAQHALRQQYQQAATTNLHNNVATQHLAAAAGICPALTPLMLMSNPELFSGLPPTSVTMLSHINQVAQSHGKNNSMTTAAAAAAAAQIAANGRRAAAAHAAYQVAAAAQSVAQASLDAPTSGHNSPVHEHPQRDGPALGGKNSETRDERAIRELPPVNHTLTTRLSSDGYTSPQSSDSSVHEIEQISNGSLSNRSGSINSSRDITDGNENSHPQWDDSTNAETDCVTEDHEAENESEHMAKCSLTDEGCLITSSTAPSLGETVAISSMQTLLTNIQSLLKVAADNARLQEKHTTFEIEDLKAKLNKEERLRSAMETRYQDSERARSQIEKRLKEERKERKILQGKLSALQRQLENSGSKIGSTPTTPITGMLGCGRKRSKSVSPTCYSGKQRKTSTTTSFAESFCRETNTYSMDSYSVSSESLVSSPPLGESGAPIVRSGVRFNGNSNDNRNGALSPQSNLMSSPAISIGHHSSDLDQDKASEKETTGEEYRRVITCS